MMKKQQYILGLKDGYNLKKEQVLNIVYSAISEGIPKIPSESLRDNNMAKVEKLKQKKAGCLVIRATEEEAEIIAKKNPDLFVELEIFHEKY